MGLSSTTRIVGGQGQWTPGRVLFVCMASVSMDGWGLIEGVPVVIRSGVSLTGVGKGREVLRDWLPRTQLLCQENHHGASLRISHDPSSRR